MDNNDTKIRNIQLSFLVPQRKTGVSVCMYAKVWHFLIFQATLLTVILSVLMTYKVGTYLYTRKTQSSNVLLLVHSLHRTSTETLYFHVIIVYNLRLFPCCQSNYDVIYDLMRAANARWCHCHRLSVRFHCSGI